MTGSDRTTVYGGQGNDQIAGTNTQSVLVGGADNDIFYLAGATVPGNQAITISDFVTGFDKVSFGGPASTTNNFSSAQITGGLNEAKMAAATSGTTYTFVAGSTDGYLFFNPNAGGGGVAPLQGATLTGDNNINSVRFTDIFSGAPPTAPLASAFPTVT